MRIYSRSLTFTSTDLNKTFKNLKQMPKRPPTSLNSHFHGMSDAKLFFPEKFDNLFDQLFRLEKLPEVEDLPCSKTEEAAHGE